MSCYKKILTYIVPSIIISSIFIVLVFSEAHATYVKRHTTLMGTDVEIVVVENKSKEFINKSINLAISEMKRLEKEMSEWTKDSQVYAIDSQAGKRPVRVSQELFHVISSAIKISELSDGAFDISWAALRGLWNFTNGKKYVPSPEQIHKRLKLVNYKNIILDKTHQTVFLKNKGMAIGLGGIAKGYIVDMAMQVLVNNGINNAIIKAGGDMRVEGTKNSRPWRISIRHPRDPNKSLGILYLSNISISTSGDYERFFMKNGIRYHHIINPETGYPAKGVMSVTILAPDTMTSDALSTTVFVLGPEKGLKLIEMLPGIEGIIVDAKGTPHYSPGIIKSMGHS